MQPFTIALHGGAGTIHRAIMPPEKEAIYRAALQDALYAGYAILQKQGTAVEAVEAAVIILENNPLFNAGKGAVFTSQGKHEMDAAIMNGQNLDAGAVSLIKNVRNPIQLARLVMEQSPHVYLCGEGAETFAREHHLPFEPDEYFYNEYRFEQWQLIKGQNNTRLDHSTHNPEKKFGTVGAVALDVYGNLAAATSTGGMTNKKFGRIGDSPLIGAGTYANNNTCAVSCTGHGELFIRAVAAYDVSALMEYKGLTLQQACELVVHQKLADLKAEGGLIAVDRNGDAQLCFNSEGMYRAAKSSSGSEVVAIYK